MRRFLLLLVCLLAMDVRLVRADSPANARPPQSDDDLKAWLGNMVWRHKYSVEEVSAATGLSIEAVDAAMKKFDIRLDNSPPVESTDKLLVLPYPGGRHPAHRIPGRGRRSAAGNKN